ncbi:cell division protein ZapE, partial [Pseudomonadales bacterium]|nr:cell division protein ZapE [Pseudomonadales bacterium]
VHQELATLADTKNPLEVVADRIAAEAKVICFDEFFVSDITDAMILAGMFDALFKRGVCLVATSNIAPDGLYKDGLQRARFLPAIDLIKQHTEVLNIDGGVDYRLRTLERAELYYTPLDDGADISLLQSFERLVPQRDNQLVSPRKDTRIEVEGRYIDARYLADDVVWFDFDAICDGPRSQNDYIEIAKEFHAVLISNVPQMGTHNEDRARRFINLVDEFYDRNIKLVLSASVNLQDLYQEGRLAFEFQRTCSRLQEMQSHEYLAAAHKA